MLHKLDSVVSFDFCTAQHLLLMINTSHSTHIFKQIVSKMCCRLNAVRRGFDVFSDVICIFFVFVFVSMKMAKRLSFYRNMCARTPWAFWFVILNSVKHAFVDLMTFRLVDVRFFHSTVYTILPTPIFISILSICFCLLLPLLLLILLHFAKYQWFDGFSDFIAATASSWRR